MKIPFFVQEFTEEMEEAAIHALRNESFVDVFPEHAVWYKNI